MKDGTVLQLLSPFLVSSNSFLKFLGVFIILFTLPSHLYPSPLYPSTTRLSPILLSLSLLPSLYSPLCLWVVSSTHPSSAPSFCTIVSSTPRFSTPSPLPFAPLPHFLYPITHRDPLILTAIRSSQLQSSIFISPWLERVLNSLTVR